MKQNNAKIAFLSQRPPLLQYIKDVDFSLNEVISIEEYRTGHGVYRYLFRGLEFAFLVETDKDFSFFKNKLRFNEALADADL